MKGRKHILKEAAVLLIVTIMVLSSAVTMANNVKQQTTILNDSKTDFLLETGQKTIPATQTTGRITILSEKFEDPSFPPVGWIVVNNGGDCVWQRNDYYGRPNFAGTGFCADADSDYCGGGTTMDTELWSPTLSLDGVIDPHLTFFASYKHLDGDYADVDISIDGGNSWSNLLHWTSNHNPYGPGEFVDIPLCSGQSDVIIRWVYFAPTWDWWYQIDDVLIYGREPENINAVLEWEWDGTNAWTPNSNRVMTTPIVADLDIGFSGAEIVFITYENQNYMNDGILRAVHGGGGGSIYFDVRNYRVSPLSTPAIGNIDDEFLPEIIALKEPSGSSSTSDNLYAFEHHSAWKWTSTPNTPMDRTAAPAIADLNNDNIPEIIVGDIVFDNAGILQDIGGHGKGRYISCIADIDLDGEVEIIAGNTVYRYTAGTLSVKWENTLLPDGYTAIGDFDNDPEAEIVLVYWSKEGTGEVYLLEHDCTIIWGPVELSQANGGKQGGSPPIIEDFDGDCYPDIGIVTKTEYQVYDRFGNLLWPTAPIIVDGSCRTGSTVFDLNGDGLKDVIFSDQETLWIYDGRNGNYQWYIENPSGTCLETPVVSDVDYDGHAEIIVARNDAFNWPSNTNGIRVFGDENNNWTCAREIWNQHTYHITNIDDNATVPSPELNNWELYNNYRVQQQGTGGPKICCPAEGLSWQDVEPGELVTSSIFIVNCGGSCSELDWNVTEWPSWGTNWTFEPKEGEDLTPQDPGYLIGFTFNAPLFPGWQFTGSITICNKEDPFDCCGYSLFLETPLNQQASQSQSIFSQLLKRYLKDSTHVSNPQPCPCQK